jgi:uncharacterized repeat protein (TIGR02543 family)
VGWYTDSGFSGTALTSIPTGSTGDKTFYAKWNPPVAAYTITYELDGGTNAGANPATYTAANLPLTLAAPTRTGGYTFEGWYTNSGFTGTAVTAIPAGTTGDKTFYAKWTPPAEEPETYTITYVLDGGINAGTNPATYTDADLPLTLAAPTRAGYTFEGWYTNSGFTGTVVTQIPAGSTGDKTFYAKWTAAGPGTYTITYVLDGGTNAVENPATYTAANLPLPLATPTRPGYNFWGWYTNSGFTGSEVTSIPIGSTGNKTFYALWSSPITYNITYYRNFGTFEEPPKPQYTVEDLPLTLATPTRTGGYTFGGWYTDNGFTGTAFTQIPTGNTGNKTFYAKWIHTMYTITYHLNGGINAGENPATYTIANLPLTLAAPTRTGYTFGGWYTDSGFTGTAVTQIPTGSTENKTFYAKWTLNFHDQPITLSIENFTDEAAGAFDDTPISLAKPGGTKTIEVESGVTDVSWYIGLVKIKMGNSIELSAANLTVGTHTLRVTARYDGILYSKELAFTVTN